ncbi:MAG TPA: transposase [Vicinamibacterales bacterium]|nr:transposase [Vicinamibacterales bacterium]
MRTGRPSRLKGFNYIGFHRYFLTFCTDWRRPWFTNASAVGLVREQFLRVANKERFAILAYCFMPNHVHLLVEGLAEDSDCRSFIVKSKQCSAHAYAKEFQARLWQPAGYEHVLRDDERVHVVARYILENPVRAGLAPTVLDYPFLGSEVYDVKELLDGLL